MQLKIGLFKNRNYIRSIHSHNPYFINLPFQRNLSANRHFQLIKWCNPIFDISVDLTSTFHTHQIKGSNPILVSNRLLTSTIVKGW